MPQFSIIVPIYKVEPYLRCCVDSVLEQTFMDFELILVDDGSPDSCGVICDEYAQKDSRVRVIHKSNGGLSSARNAGLDVAEGTYVYFLDSDDYIEKNLLEITFEYMQNGSDVVSFCYRRFTDEGEYWEAPYQIHGEFDLKTKEDRKDFIINKLLTFRIGWEACSRVFRRSLIEEYHLRFAPNKKIFAEDLHFSLCYYGVADKIVCLNKCLYNYRKNPNSIMARRKFNIDKFNELSKEIYSFYHSQDKCTALVESYHTVHYMIISRRLFLDLYEMDISAKECKTIIRKSIGDWAFFEKNIQTQIKEWWELQRIFPFCQWYLDVAYYKYFFGGAYFWLRIRIKVFNIIDRLWGIRRIW